MQRGSGSLRHLALSDCRHRVAIVGISSTLGCAVQAPGCVAGLPVGFASFPKFRGGPHSD
ncbi:hypothetical protein BDN67DRAFT_679738 [Paxillus ammoniavirescens]|nr:hypothetical protein BDN67DRAFT_679738 [Paxillus ammoniavirescens]